MSKYSPFFLLSFFFCLLSYSLAGIIQVPQDRPSIQEGINAAINGDTVLVADSTYYENINFLGKAITVASHYIMDLDTHHINNTIINGSQPVNPDSGSVVFFVSGEDTNSVIYGFTITGGTGTLYDNDNRIGGGIYYENSGARISSNKIISNSITNAQRSWGGGIGTYPWLHDLHQIIIEDNIIKLNTINAIDRSRGGGICLIQGTIIRNKIRLNSCSSRIYTAVGGGIKSFSDTTFNRALVIIRENIISHNQTSSTYSGGIGGGVDIEVSNVHLVNNEISYNNVSGVSTYGGGVRIRRSKELSTVENNIISHNGYTTTSSYGAGGGLWMVGTSGVTVARNYFNHNTAHTLGGGMLDQQSFGTVISGNTFIGNKTNPVGAACGGFGCMESYNILVTGNLFKENESFQCGGLGSQNSISRIKNNLFVGNQAQTGGAIGISQIPPLNPPLTNWITNNTITGNIADTAGGIWLEEGLILETRNNIFWQNSAPFASEIYIQGGTMEIAYSNIRTGGDSIMVGSGATLNLLTGNIDTDPLFLKPESSWCCLHSLSPCIDAGDPDLTYNDPEDPLNTGFAMWPARGTVRNDMGVFGGPLACDWDPIYTRLDEKHSDDISVPTELQLFQNYPNPFNPITNIEFQIPKYEFVNLKIYNLVGQVVAILLSASLPSGSYKYEWDASGIASGVYVYRLQAGSYSETRKMVLMR